MNRKTRGGRGVSQSER